MAEGLEKDQTLLTLEVLSGFLEGDHILINHSDGEGLTTKMRVDASEVKFIKILLFFKVQKSPFLEM